MISKSRTWTFRDAKTITWSANFTEYVGLEYEVGPAEFLACPDWGVEDTFSLYLQKGEGRRLERPDCVSTKLRVTKDTLVQVGAA